MREGRARHFDPGLLDCFFARFEEVRCVQARFPDTDA
jgi:hypothetical protein